MQEPYLIPKDLYCVIGWPLDQSLSPLVHNIGFQVCHIPSTYLRFSVQKEDLPRFMTAVTLLPVQGCSVTIPHKQAVMEYLDGCSEEAKRIGAVNTLFWKDRKLWGTNTDITGFLTPITHLPLSSMSVLLLGAGGAARAAVCGLTRSRVQNLYIATPSNTSHIPLADEFHCTPVDWEERHAVSADMIVNATPIGMHGELSGMTPYDFEKGNGHGKTTIAYDIVYNPLRTRFLQDAEKRGIQTISGFQMFFQQANAQFALWTGRNLPKEAKDALQNALMND